jgi:ABC-type antimicrobial peptide transport system permease subunit
MFFTYLRRELRRRRRQTIVVALGLALGIGLVIVVTAASDGVKNAQASVLHSLYGVGTDMTVAQQPSQGSGEGGGGFRIGLGGGNGSRPAAGTHFDRNSLTSRGYAPLNASSVTSITKLPGVAAAGGALTLNDTEISGTIPSSSSGGFPGGGPGGGPGGAGGGGGAASFTPNSFGVLGVDTATGEVGPLSSSKLTSGRTFATSDANSDVALVDSNYASQNKLAAGSTISIGGSSGSGTSFKVIGLVQAPPGATPSDLYIPLARAQALGTAQGSGLSGKVNTIYVAATSATEITTVQKEINKLMPSATVTTSSDLANEVTGSLSSTASLANNLGKWLSIAVLVAAFLVASLLTMAAVSRRVREFGTLKALGWRSRRIIGQVMGESIATGIIGGAVGVGIGFGGAALVSRLAPSLSATVGQTTGSATPGGARQFNGGGPGGLGGFPGAGGGGAGGGGGGGGAFRRALGNTGHTVAVHLTAPVTISAIVLAVVLAVAGGLIAGSFGGWRAARLRPAAALARVE